MIEWLANVGWYAMGVIVGLHVLFFGVALVMGLIGMIHNRFN